MSTVTSTLTFPLLGRPTWFWVIFLFAGWVINKTVIRGFMRRRRERQFRLEQRRRHNIPDSDHRPFKIALAAAELRSREEVTARRKAENEDRERKRLEEKKKDFGSWEKKVVGISNAVQRRSAEDGQYRRDSVGAGSGPAAGSSQRVTRRRQPSYDDISPPKPIPARLTNRPPPLRNVSNRAPTPSRIPSNRAVQPSKKRNRSSTDPEDEEVVEERQIKSLRRGVNNSTNVGKRQRQVSSRTQEDVEMDSDTLLSDEDGQGAPDGDEDEEMEELNDGSEDEAVGDSGSEDMAVDSPQKVSAVRQGKKRLIDDVDVESNVAGSGGRARGGGGKRRRSRNSGDDRRPEFIENSTSEEDSPPRTRRRARAQARPTPSKSLPRRLDQKQTALILPEKKEHAAGDEWTDASGSQWRKGSDGVTLRLAAVKEERKKFPMPQDSDHPDSLVDMFIYVEKWLTPEQYQKAKDEKLLSWQAEESKSNPQATNPSPSSLLAPRIRPSASLASLKAGNRNFTPLRRSVLASQSPGFGDLSFSPGSLSRSSSTMSLARGLAGGVLGRSLTPSRSVLGFGTPERKQLSEAGRLQRQEELMKRLRGPSVSEVKPETVTAAPPPLSSTPVAPISTPQAAEKPSTPFSFGQPPSQPEAKAPQKSNMPSFNFGSSAPAIKPTTTEEKKTTSTPSFTFGSGSSTTPSPAPALTAPAASTPSFSFGAKPAEPAKEASPAPAAPSLNFGQSTPAITTPAVPITQSTPAAAPTSTPSFSFGASPSQPTPPSSSGTPSFSFGSAPAASGSTPATGQANQGGTGPTFAFGATPAQPPAQAPAAAPSASFTFGSTPAPQAQAQAQPSSTPSFSFGSQTSSQPTQSTGQPATPSGSFTFGATAPAAGAAPSFSFGAPSNSPSNPAPANGGFSFGAAPQPSSNGPTSRPMRPLRSRTGGLSGTFPAQVQTPAINQPAGGNNPDTSMASNSNRSASPATFSFSAPPPNATSAGGAGSFSFGAGGGKRENESGDQRPVKKGFTFGS